MKRSYLFVLVLFIVSLVFCGSVIADEKTTYFQSEIIETFDDPESQWHVRGSKFITEGFPEYKRIPTYPEAAFPDQDDGEDLQSFGIQFMFDRQGYNYLEIYPVTGETDEDGNPVPRTIQLPGRVANLDLWVWGSNYNYYLEVHILDNDGRVHVLDLGDLDYMGWKNLTTDIPTYIDQSIQYAPQRRGLELIKLVVWTRPTERVADFYSGEVQPIYLYIDQLKIFTDQFETPYDGSDLAQDIDYIQELWANGE